MTAIMYCFLIILYILGFQISDAGAVEPVSYERRGISILSSVTSVKQRSDFRNEEVTAEAAEY